ncbi:hypothetical protein OSB04_011028 [Centaurea solstitialis]|uniref:CCHC-type domain-containing protein n=1 Tax=Centaurea solstitialis TaxID=347529 RepID=A0AA38WNQ2_9ASTR|nr:hypothetical protein OSB04_011028 [Centaurea solstitialis]
MANERMKIYRYRNILKPEIREFVAMAQCDSFQQMHEKARTRELELKRQGKKKRAERVQPHQQVVKKFKTANQKGEARKDHPRCSRCGKNHPGECRMGSGTCYKCGKPGDISRDCKVEPKMCFKCFRPGHFANECPTAVVSTEILGSIPIKAIEGGSSKKVEAPKTRARVFQLTADEAKAEPGMVTGIFLVNSMPALVLFDTGASKSFVSLSFCKDFMKVKSKLEILLEVEISDKEFCLCNYDYKNNVIEVEGVKFSIDLIPDGIFINQAKYVQDLLKRFDFGGSNSAATPMPRNFQLNADTSGKPVDQKTYRAIIGSLLYLTASRPDIVFSTGVCARFQCDPRDSHLSAVKRILRYLKGTPDFGLWYPKDSGFELIAYTDSDHAGCKLNRKSTSGACQFLGDKLVSWSSRKQNCVSLSTAEAEYVAAACCCSQVLWMKTQLADFGYTMHRIPIYCDSKSAIQITANPVQHSRTKHIDIRYHFIKDHVEKGNVELYFVESDYQLADLFTKPFDEKRHFFLLSKLGMLDLPA